MILEVIALGAIALSGTAKVAKKYSNQLKTRFRQDLLDAVYKNANDSKCPRLEELEEAEAYIKSGRGGIFASLWDLGELLNSGLYINIKDIPVFQETIEICNFLDINPYELESEGLYLIATKSGYALCERLKNEGYNAVIIGHTTNNNDRIVKNGELVRYIEKNRGKEELERIEENE